ncbi:MAG: hypothetical protein ABSH06_11930 [Thermodesulfobacteriota bacterium]|jgi:hypothetical protein
MKQIKDTLFVFPGRKPKTLLGIYRWHRKILKNCIKFEFKKRALQTAINKINEELEYYVSVKNDFSTAKEALVALGTLKKEFQHELLITKKIVKVFHDSNEMIIGNHVRSHKGNEIIRHVQNLQPTPGSNILHGHGWLSELEVASIQENEGYLPFITFGTVFDSAGWDIISFSKPRRRIVWRARYPRFWVPRKAHNKRLHRIAQESSSR